MGRQRALVLALAALAACSGGFDAAARLEARGAHAQAAAAFKRFATESPDDPKAPEALVRAGRILAGLGRCPDAVPLYERAARAAGDWADRAKADLLACPDYFPLDPGARWEYVDSQTGGRNMREVVVSTGAAGALERTLYAGQTVVERRTTRFERKDWAVRESGGAAVLRYPFAPGTKWKGPGGRLAFEIVANDAKVRTRAGVFEGCLKVKAVTPAVSTSWKYDYYCPGVGRVATTVGGPGFESPNSELKTFSPPSGDDVVK